MKYRIILCGLLLAVSPTTRARADHTDTKWSNTRFNEGWQLEQDGNIDGAIAKYTDAIKLNPNMGAYMDRGVIYERKGDLKAALADFESARRAAPGDWRPHLNIGGAYSGMRNYFAALQEYDNVINMAPFVYQAWRGRCWIYAVAGEPAAIDYCNRAIGIEPRDDLTLVYRGYAYLRIGEFPRAKADFDVLCAKYPKDNGALYLRAIAKLNLRDKEGGEADIARVTQDFAARLEKSYPGLPH